ncbi:MAG: PqqD family protein [Azospirillaceae bacterium]|nr:PqqD family protein [Azospirillaceae bacterium]
MVKTPHFEPDTIVAQRAGQLAAEIDAQVVVMGLAQGIYVGFDDIASIIWRRLERPQTVATLCEGLAREFSGDPAVIRQDVCDLLDRLDELDLVVVSADGRSA